MDPHDAARLCRPGPSSGRRYDGEQETDRRRVPFQLPARMIDDPRPGPSGCQTYAKSPPPPPPVAYPSPVVGAWPDADGRGRCPSSFGASYAPGRVPPDCLDWTLNPADAPPRQFKTTSQPLFTLGYNTTISEDWMRGDEGLQYSIKNFTFSTKRTTAAAAAVADGDGGGGTVDEYDSLLVSIPQALEGDYHYYVWPASPVLAWILWEHRFELLGKRILEVGSGTSLPGIVAAKCGAIVTLTDDPTVSGTMQHIKKCCHMNSMYPEQIRVLGLQWGYFFYNSLNIGSFDLIIGSDCFYEPMLYEDLIATISYILEQNPLAKFMTTYHERDTSTYEIDGLARKWKLQCVHKSLEDLGKNSELDIYELMKGNNIHLIEFTKKTVKKKKKKK